MLFITWALLVNVAMATDGVKHLTEPEGDILYNYTEMSANDTNMSWLITGDSGQVITLRINTLQLPTPKGNSCAESVSVYDGPNASATALGWFCGSGPRTEPPVRYLRSEGNQLFISYTSDIAGQPFVFEASYWEHECPKFQYGQESCNMTCPCDAERTVHCVSLTGECVCRDPWTGPGCSVDREKGDTREDDRYPEFYERASADDSQQKQQLQLLQKQQRRQQRESQDEGLGDLYPDPFDASSADDSQQKQPLQLLERKQQQQHELQDKEVNHFERQSGCSQSCGGNSPGQACPCRDDGNVLDDCRESKSLSVQIDVTQRERYRRASRCYAGDVERFVKQSLQLMSLTLCGVKFSCKSSSREIYLRTQKVEGNIALGGSQITKKVQSEVMLALLELESKTLEFSDEVTLTRVTFEGNEDCQVKQKVAPCPDNEECAELNGKAICRSPRSGKHNFMFLLYAAPPMIMVVVVVFLSCLCQYRMRHAWRDAEDSEDGNSVSDHVDNHGLCPDETLGDNSEQETKVVVDPEGKDGPVTMEIINETVAGKETQ